MSHVVTGSGCSDAGVEHLGQLDEDQLDPVGPGLEQVEGLVTDTAVLARDGVGVADVGLAHLEEGAAAGEQPQGRVDEFACERVQYDVDAAAAGDGEELLLELEWCGSRRCGRRRSPWPATCPTWLGSR